MSTSTFVFEYRKYPIVPIRFYSGGKETPVIDALLDSGGDFIVIPMPIAKYLDLKLEKAGSVDTAGGVTNLYKTRLSMDMGKKDKIYTYKDIEIHVSARHDIPVLLGRYPIFEDYEITFKRHEEQLVLRLIPT